MIDCTIISSQKKKHYEKVRSVTLQSFSGQVQILSGHAEAFLLLQSGDAVVRYLSDEKEVIPILGGECYIKDNNVIIIL